MKRKIFSLLLCLLMVVALLPTAALAQKSTVTVEWYQDVTDSAPAASVERPYGEPFSGPAQPSAREGYYFLGWFYDKELTRPFDAEYPVLEDTSLYPLWVREGLELPINPVVLSTTWSIDPGSSISDFLYRYLNADPEGHFLIQTAATKEIGTYFYDLSDGTPLKSGEFLAGHTYVLSARLLATTGYRLDPGAAYYLQSGESYYKGEVFCTDPFRVEFVMDDAHKADTVVVAFYLDTDDEYPTAGYEHPKGIPVTHIAAPAREGVYFGGWYKDKAFTQPFDPTEPLYRDTTYYAKWIEAETGTPLDLVCVSMTGPESGMTVGDVNQSVAVTDGNGKAIPFSCLTWYFVTGDGMVELSAKDTFQPEQTYQYRLNLTLEGYQFSIYKGHYAEVGVSVNGDRSGAYLDASDTGEGAVVGTLTLPSAPPVVVAADFKDVPAAAWYRDAVYEAVKLGLVNGKSADRYDPDANMTFAEAAKLAACMHQKYTTGKVTLANSPAGTPWYKSYVDYCVRNDILSADAADVLRISGQAVMENADRFINRQEYVHIFAHALPEKAFPAINNIPADSIPDVPLTMGAWSKYIYEFYRAGIVNGNDSRGTFKPENNIKRSEVATILVRMMEPQTRVDAPVDLGK